MVSLEFLIDIILPAAL